MIKRNYNGADQEKNTETLTPIADLWKFKQRLLFIAHRYSRFERISKIIYQSIEFSKHYHFNHQLM